MKTRTVFSYEWLSARILAEAVRNAAARLDGGRILDVGCGEKPYRSLFPVAKMYIGLEHPASLHARHSVDVFGSADALPFCEGSFDAVVAFEVLEHLEHPANALREIARVLKAGGQCAIFVPFIYHLHEHPRDFFRYTPYSLESMIKGSGMVIESIEHNSGFWVTMAILSCNYFEKYQRSRLMRPFVALLLAGIQLMGLGLQNLFRTVERKDRVERFSYHYVAIARKP